MVTKEDLIFRQVVTLRDGARILLRPLIPDDRQALIDMFSPTPFEERRYMRHNVNDPDVVGAWCDAIDHEKVYPLVAVVGDRIVGITTLHFFEGPAKHRGEIRIFLVRDFRNRGLGRKMLQAIIDHGKRRSLYLIEAQVIRDNVNDIKAFQKAGFEPICTFEDYFILPDGTLRDVVVMQLRLRPQEIEF